MQEEIVEALLKPETYEKKVKKIVLIQTYHSFVFLTGKIAYKIKKAVKFPYFDFSTLEKRKKDLEKELKLNQRLSRGLYLEIVPIAQENKKIKIKGSGKVIEYALKMKQIPERFLMSKLLEKDKVNKATIGKIAKVVAKFHLKAETNKKIKKFGSIETISFNWKENFDQTKEFISKTITTNQFYYIKQKIRDFIQRNRPLFEKRIKEGKIKDCHGDLHSESIFISDKIYVFDCLEFIDRFRFCDVASEAAFLAMDLDFHGKNNFSNYFIGRYMVFTGDKELLKLIPFYKCYRAYVRGKVVSFKLNDPNINREEKKVAEKTARKYFSLSHKYATEI